MTEARRIYHLNRLDLGELNFLLSQIADRLDQMEGYRGRPQFKSDVDFGGNKGINASGATSLTDVATLGNVSSEVSGIMNPLVNMIYPVGAILITTKSENPSTYLGGTWEAFAKGRCLIGIDPDDADFDTLEKTGGSKTHYHTVDIPSTTSGTPSGSDIVQSGTGELVASQDHTHDIDPAQVNSSTEKALPPYITVYIWKRIK